MTSDMPSVRDGILTICEVKSSSKQTIKKALSQSTVPVEKEWMVPLLATLLEERRACVEVDEDTNHLDSMVYMLCSINYD